MNRILVFSSYPAFFPPKSGGEARLFNIYKNISKNFEVTLVSLSHPCVKTEVIRHDPRFTEIRVPRSKATVYMHALVDRLSDIKECSAVIGSIDAMLFNGIFRSEAMKAIEGCDTIIFNSPYMFVLPLKAYHDKRVIYESQNAEYDLMRKSLGDSGIARLLARYARGREKALLERSDVVTAVSDDDASSLSALSGGRLRKIRTLENGIDLNGVNDVWAARDGRRRGGRLCVFIGSYHPPNIEAIRTIGGFSSQDRTLTFIAAGSAGRYFKERGETEPAEPMFGMEGIYRLKGYENVYVKPSLDDAEKKALLSSGDVALNPMNGGSGTNIKVLEYMAAGIPVITTPCGARGLRVESGRHVLISEADGFPASIGRLLADDALYGMLAAEGRKLVEGRYDWSRIATELEGALGENA